MVHELDNLVACYNDLVVVQTQITLVNVGNSVQALRIFPGFYSRGRDVDVLLLMLLVSVRFIESVTCTCYLP
jgi:hypothetical protein